MTRKNLVLLSLSLSLCVGVASGCTRRGLGAQGPYIKTIAKLQESTPGALGTIDPAPRANHRLTRIVPGLTEAPWVLLSIELTTSDKAVLIQSRPGAPPRELWRTPPGAAGAGRGLRRIVILAPIDPQAVDQDDCVTLQLLQSPAGTHDPQAKPDASGYIYPGAQVVEEMRLCGLRRPAHE